MLSLIGGRERQGKAGRHSPWQKRMLGGVSGDRTLGFQSKAIPLIAETSRSGYRLKLTCGTLSDCGAGPYHLKLVLDVPAHQVG